MCFILKQELMKQNQERSSFESWALKKNAILAKYTTLEKLTITSSFLTPISGAVSDKGLLQFILNIRFKNSSILLFSNFLK